MTARTWLTNNALLLATIAGVVAGIVLGFGFRSAAGGAVSGVWLQIISYPGELFTRALQLVILPLIMSSLLVGSASLNASANGKIAIRTLTYFFTTSLFNAILGVVIVTLVHPGDPSSRSTHAGGPGASVKAVIGERRNTMLDNILDLGRNLVPANIFTAMFQQTQTVYEEWIGAGKAENVRTIVLRDGTNTLGVIVFAMIFGMVLGTLSHRPQARALIESFRVIDEVIMKIVTGVMWITPVGVGSLIAAKILSVDNIVTTVSQVGRFILTVTSGLMFSQLVVLQTLYFVIIRKNPFRVYAGLVEATITGFATASAAVALPISFRCMEKLRVVQD